MKEHKQNIDEILSLEEKRKILIELEQEDLIALFNKKQVGFKAVSAKPTVLDQRIALGIGEDERNKIKEMIIKISKSGKTSISSYIRNRALSFVDIVEWAGIARTALQEMSSPKYNRAALQRERYRLIRLVEREEKNTPEERHLRKKLKEVEGDIAGLATQNKRKKYRLAGRVSFDEANNIRWRAARLSLSVADYLRFLLFDYAPFSDADKHMSLESKKRFYISILDVATNGWGNPPKVHNCPNCARYADALVKSQQKTQQKNKS